MATGEFSRERNRESSTEKMTGGFLAASTVRKREGNGGAPAVQGRCPEGIPGGDERFAEGGGERGVREKKGGAAASSISIRIFRFGEIREMCR